MTNTDLSGNLEQEYFIYSQDRYCCESCGNWVVSNNFVTITDKFNLCKNCYFELTKDDNV